MSICPPTSDRLLCLARRNIPTRPKYGSKLHFNSTKGHRGWILSIICCHLWSIREMRAWASPPSSLLKAPRVRQRKKGDRSSRSLSRSLPRSLAPSLLLCAQVWALTHQLQQQLFTGNKSRKMAPGMRVKGSVPLGRNLPRGRGGGLVCFVRVAEKKSLRGHIQALCCGVPPLSTRVIDGWGSFWPRLVHFALQRVPPSPSPTTTTHGATQPVFNCLVYEFLI